MWLESHGNLARHPKTRRLMQRMGWTLPFTIGNLHLLWWWALEYAPTGDLTHIEPEQLTYDLDLKGATPEQFIDAMIHAGFLDRSEDGGIRIHDWPDYTTRSLRPKFRRHPERWHQVLRSYGLPIPPKRNRIRPSTQSSSRTSVSAQSAPSNPPQANRDDQSALSEPQGAARIDYTEGFTAHHAGSDPAVAGQALRADPNVPQIDSATRNTDATHASQVPIPQSLATQPNFTDTWWPKFLEMYKRKGCPLTDFEQREFLDRLARIDGKPHPAVQMLKTAVKNFENTNSSQPNRKQEARFANST